MPVPKCKLAGFCTQHNPFLVSQFFSQSPLAKHACAAVRAKSFSECSVLVLGILSLGSFLLQTVIFMTCGERGKNEPGLSPFVKSSRQLLTSCCPSVRDEVCMYCTQ